MVRTKRSPSFNIDFESNVFRNFRLIRRWGGWRRHCTVAHLHKARTTQSPGRGAYLCATPWGEGLPRTAAPLCSSLEVFVLQLENYCSAPAHSSLFAPLTVSLYISIWIRWTWSKGVCMVVPCPESYIFLAMSMSSWSSVQALRCTTIWLHLLHSPWW